MTDHSDGRPLGADEPARTPEWVDEVRARYNPPPPTPGEEMWAVVRQGLEDGGQLQAGGSRSVEGGGPAAGHGGQVIDLTARRARSGGRGASSGLMRRRVAWATAAAAVLAVGIGIGRWSAPAVEAGGGSVAVEATAPDGGDGLALAARLHFGRTESLLASVRSDARSGRVDASVGPWAKTLLTQTRLLMDARGDARDETQRLLVDLELVLVQILGATEAGAMDGDRGREELDLAVRSLERGELLTRVRSAAPTTMAGA